MHYGIISDTHLHDALGDGIPDWIAAAFTGVDLILHAGDMVDPAMVEVLQAIAPVCVVRGNMDPHDPHLPLDREIPFGKDLGTIVIAHRPESLHRALGHHPRPGTTIAINGHTHVAEFKKVGGIWYLNPGSPTHPRGGQRPSVAILTIDGDGMPHAEFKYPPDCADE